MAAYIPADGRLNFAQQATCSHGHTEAWQNIANKVDALHRYHTALIRLQRQDRNIPELFTPQFNKEYIACEIRGLERSIRTAEESIRDLQEFAYTINAEATQLCGYDECEDTMPRDMFEQKMECAFAECQQDILALQEQLESLLAAQLSDDYSARVIPRGYVPPQQEMQQQLLLPFTDPDERGGAPLHHQPRHVDMSRLNPEFNDSYDALPLAHLHHELRHVDLPGDFQHQPLPQWEPERTPLATLVPHAILLETAMEGYEAQIEQMRRAGEELPVDLIHALIKKGAQAMTTLNDIHHTFNTEPVCIAHRCYYHIYFIQKNETDVIDPSQGDWGNYAFNAPEVPGLDQSMLIQHRQRALQRVYCEVLLKTIEEQIDLGEQVVTAKELTQQLDTFARREMNREDRLLDGTKERLIAESGIISHETDTKENALRFIKALSAAYNKEWKLD